jgi:hypothetical protein
VLEGDNVRHGFNRDLGFTEADRVENMPAVMPCSPWSGLPVKMISMRQILSVHPSRYHDLNAGRPEAMANWTAQRQHVFETLCWAT